MKLKDFRVQANRKQCHRHHNLAANYIVCFCPLHRNQKRKIKIKKQSITYNKTMSIFKVIQYTRSCFSS